MTLLRVFGLIYLSQDNKIILTDNVSLSNLPPLFNKALREEKVEAINPFTLEPSKHIPNIERDGRALK